MASKRVSLINLIEGEILSPVFPIFMPMAMFATFRKEGDEVNPDVYLEVKLNGVILARPKIAFNFAIPTQPSKSVLDIGLLAISTSGNLTISAFDETNNRTLLERNIVVIRFNPPVQQQ